MITNQFRIYLCHFRCLHWQNHLLNFKFREKGPLVLVKTTFSSLFWINTWSPMQIVMAMYLLIFFITYAHKMILWDFFLWKYMSEQHWQMCHIRLHGWSNHERGAQVIYLLTTDRQTVIYYSTNHAQELIYFDSNT